MEKKLCLIFIVFLIDSLYTAEIQIGNQDINDNNFPIPVHQCKSNEIWSSDENICELTCDVPTPPPSCLEKKASSCTCLGGYVRNDLNQCILLSECPQKISERLLILDTTFNWTQNADFEEDQNITLLDDKKIVRSFQKFLNDRLNLFLRLLQNRTQTNSGRNARNTDSADQNVQYDYRNYMSRLRASSENASGLELNL